MTGRLDSLARSLLDDLDDLDDLVAEMTVQVIERAPALHGGAADIEADTGAWLRRVTTAALEAVAKGESLEVLGPMIEEIARHSRARGIGREQTLRAYEVAQQALLDRLGRQLRGDPQETELFPQVTGRLLEFQRVTTLWVAAGYGSAEPRNRDRDSDTQVLLEILAGRRAAQGDDGDLARRLGLSLPWREVTVSVGLGPALAATVRGTGRVNRWSVVGALDGRMVALTLRPPQAFPEPYGTARLPDDAGPQDVEAALLAAGRAADLAAKLGQGRLTAAQSAPLSAMLALPEAERAAYVEGCFQALPRTARGRALLTAVSATLTYGRSGEAARALHVHRHTLDYRLGRFASETGLDLGDPVTRFRCMIGLFLIGLMPYRAEPDG
jgi:hypothetical protein